MKIKICGMQNAQDAVYAARKGADLVGLMLYKKSQRAVDLERAKEIAKEVRKVGADVVGVFVDTPLSEIAEIIEILDLRYVQLHGEIAKKDHEKLPAHIHKIYAIAVDEKGKALEDAKNLREEKDFLLFDPSNGSGKTFSLENFKKPSLRFFLAGGLSEKNIEHVLSLVKPYGVDVSSGVERKGRKDRKLMDRFIRKARFPGRFGKFGGRYVPELLMQPLIELEREFEKARLSKDFQEEFFTLLQEYAGRSTPLTEVSRFASAIKGPRIFLKREDLLHTGAHKINNALGQCLLAKRMGKTRIIAETGAGQHGVATATAAARLGLKCTIYMGKVDMERQEPNVKRMRLLGAEVVAVESGSMTLKEAVNEAMRDYAASYESSHYCLGSALGPHPFPKMVAAFQSIIGFEVKEEMQKRFQKNPDLIIACVGGGSNAIGIFAPFINEDVPLLGVEAGGDGKNHAARFQSGKKGILHGMFTYLLQDENGQVAKTHSISAGLDYPAVGPQHAELFEKKRVEYVSVTDDEALEAFKLLSKTEGIIPALESSHALAYAMKIAKDLPKDSHVVINLSGRGDKDLPALFEKGVL